MRAFFQESDRDRPPGGTRSEPRVVRFSGADAGGGCRVLAGHAAHAEAFAGLDRFTVPRDDDELLTDC